MSRGLSLATLAALAILWAWSVGVYGSLPPSIPADFNATGVNRWAATTIWSWFGLPLIASGLLLLNYTIAATFSARPHLMNIPRKARLLALPAEGRARVMRWWWALMQTIGLVEVLILGVAQGAVWEAATRRGLGGRPIIAVVLALSIAMVPLSVYFVWQMSAEVGRQEAAGP